LLQTQASFRSGALETISTAAASEPPAGLRNPLTPRHMVRPGLPRRADDHSKYTMNMTVKIDVI
jgi:hypothetical protein